MGWKRLYLKNYAVSGVLSIITIFILLQSAGLIITSDGDKYCEGTLDNPCIAFIEVRNPTYKTVYVYNKENYPLIFSPDVQSSQLYVKYYGKWREMNFTMATRLPNIPKDRLYIFRFPAYSTKQFKLEVIKNDPQEDIKWSFSTLDPKFLAQYKDLCTYKTEVLWKLVPINFSNEVICAEGNLSCTPRNMTISVQQLEAYNGTVCDKIIGLNLTQAKTTVPYTKEKCYVNSDIVTCLTYADGYSDNRAERFRNMCRSGETCRQINLTTGVEI